MTALVKFENHFEGKETLVFLHNGKHIIINGCQTFSTSNMLSIFNTFKVPELMQNDVREAINSVDHEVMNDDLKLILSTYPSYLQFIDNQTTELCLAAVKNDGRALEFVKEQTLDICLAAVANEPLALQFVKEQTPEICLAAIKTDALAIQFVKDRSMALQIA